MSNHPDASGDFLAATRMTFQSHQDLAEKAIVQLTDEQLHAPLDEHTNSVAVIMKHVAGNLRSRFTDFLSSDGEKPWRDRDDEFVDTFNSRDELLAHWRRGWACLFAALDALRPDDLTRAVAIRGEPHTVVQAVCRSLAHTSYHVGQIVLVARIQAGDNWQVLTIPRGQSAEYNRRSWGGAGQGER